MTGSPSVSVIIPAYQAEHFVAEAIRSLIAQQPEVEIIVVDDGSHDATAKVAGGFGDRVRLMRSGRNEGLPSALNRGLAAAAGEIIGFLDADDLWEPGRLPIQLALLADGCADVAWGRTSVLFIDPAQGPAAGSPDWPPRHFPSLGSMLFRRSVFEAVGGFNPALKHAQDIDFLARLREAGARLRRHEDLVLIWRRHAANMTNNVGLDRDYFVAAIHDAIRRRRAAAGRPEGQG